MEEKGGKVNQKKARMQNQELQLEVCFGCAGEKGFGCLLLLFSILLLSVLLL